MSDYYRVDFKITPYSSDAADLMAAFLADTGFETFEEQPGVGLSAYITTDNLNRDDLADIIEGFPMPVSISYTEELIPHQDWNEEWEKKYFRPLVLAEGRCVIHSSFHKDYPQAEFDIVIDPKMAFGTGHHATTTLMVNRLFSLGVEGKKVLDMGTGTAILAILAKKLGAKEVIGIEIDRGAYENAIENAELNNVSLDLICGDASQLRGIKDVDLYLANINRNIILSDLDRYVATLAPKAIIVLSGFYEEDVPLIEAALNQNGMKIAELSKGVDNWVAVTAIRNF